MDHEQNASTSTVRTAGGYQFSHCSCYPRHCACKLYSSDEQRDLLLGTFVKKIQHAGSSQANPFACIASGIAALWGPAHGGANEAVLRMLEDIGSKSRIPDALARAKDKKDPFRLMGFGHRVYKTFDPRAKVMRNVCHEVLEHLQIK